MARTEAAHLIMCPTPLGNLADMPPRALEALRSCDTVCCEDTRVTGKLLAAFGIEKRLERLDEAKLAERAAGVVDRVLAGECIVYCSDAGMPGVSDPGQRLVDVALDAGVTVEVIPGPTAVSCAYVASGFTCPRFYFAGFFPRKAGEQAATLAGIAALDAVTLFYESPHRVVACLEAIAKALPLRRVAVCRELTKLHEEVVRGTAPEVAAEFARRQAEDRIRGEFVVVIDAPSGDEVRQQTEDATAKAQVKAQELLAEGAMTKKEIVAFLRTEYGISRNDAYEMVHGR